MSAIETLNISKFPEVILTIIPNYAYIQKGIFLNEFSLYFEVSFPTNKFLQDDFIKSFPCYNVLKECGIKGSFSMNSNFNSCTNGHKIVIPI